MLFGGLTFQGVQALALLSYFIWINLYRIDLQLILVFLWGLTNVVSLIFILLGAVLRE